MATSTIQPGTEGPGFKQQDASAWISFDPDLTGHRKDVRSAAAKSSAAARKATIARKLALNTDCDGLQSQASSKRSKKRRREHSDASPVSTSSTATLHSSRLSEVSLSSLASTNSSMSSGTVSPCLTQTPQMLGPTRWEFDTTTFVQATPTPPLAENMELNRALCFVLGLNTELAHHNGVKDPTHFGASRVKSRAVSNIHDAVAARRPGSAVLLAIALLAAWDLRFGDERSSLIHLRAWHQLALPQNVLPRIDSQPPANVTILEAIRISLQCHLSPDVCMNTTFLLDSVPSQPLSRKAASCREILSFFDTIGDLVNTLDVP